MEGALGSNQRVEGSIDGRFRSVVDHGYALLKPNGSDWDSVIEKQVK